VTAGKTSNQAQYGTALTTSLLIDKNSNSLIAQDIQTNIDKISKIIELLDKPIPQVLIEAKVVEANEDFNKSIGGSLGVGKNFAQTAAGGDSQLASFNGGLLSLPSLDSKSTGAFGLGATVLNTEGLILNGLSLAAFLNLSESKSQSKVISSPKITVLNNESANIVQGQPVLLGTQVTVGSGGNTTTEPKLTTANLSLNVKPTVSNDNSIMLDINIQSDNPMETGGQQAVGTRSVKTKVQTESGSTIVIGGMYTDRTIESDSGFPGLKDIPIIGTLFGKKGSNKTRSELFVFITPKVLNEDSKMDKTDLQ
jgi:type IV pilus assembly protein PilQ